VAANPDPQTQQYQLGSYTLEAVDHLTGMSADEIEVVADRLVEGSRQTEDVLRELAHRVREYGVLANERLANFVNAANACAEVARTMQANLAQRDQPLPTGSVSDTEAGALEPARARRDHDLDALEAEIKAVAPDRAPPLQPHD
jgi:hypothetical protein